MVMRTEQTPLEVMLENLVPDQKDAVDKIAKERNITPIQALLVKINQENEENRQERRENHAP